MDKQQTMIIAAVAVVAIVAIAAIVIVNPFKGGSSSGGDDDDDLRCLLRVYGNADMNNYLDNDDLAFIKEIIDGKNAWDPIKHPLADANCDDVITQADYDLVKKFLAGQAATMYYVDWDGKNARVDYPLTRMLADSNGIAVTFTTGLDIFRILGLFDEVTMMTNSDIAVADIDPKLYPGVEDIKAYSAPKMRHTADTYEMFVQNNIKVFLSEQKFLDDTCGGRLRYPPPQHHQASHQQVHGRNLLGGHPGDARSHVQQAVRHRPLHHVPRQDPG